MVIINGKIFPMEGENIDCGYIRTKGKVIEEIGPMENFKEKKREEILDVNGAWVLPGLIESHAHIGITSVMTGPGSANVAGGQFVFMKTQGRCVDHMVIKSPAAMKVAFGENPKTTYGNQNMLPSTRMGTAALLRKVLFEAVQYKRDKAEGRLDKEDFEMEPWISVLEKQIPL